MRIEPTLLVRSEPLPRSALVTGGGGGIGRAVCLLLCKCGVRVTVADRDGAAAARTVDLCGGAQHALASCCDVTERAELRGAFDAHATRWGPLDLCVCNAGVAENKGARLCVELNVSALVSTVELALERMRAQRERGGAAAAPCRIICIGSMGGILPMADQPVYAATKAAVLHYVRSLGEALELDGEAPGIVVAAIAPAVVATALAEQQARATPPSRKAALEALLSGTGFLPPEAIAAAVVRLAVTAGANGSLLRIFQDGRLRFLAPQPSTRYAWSPAPPEALAELPRAPASRL